MARKLNQGSNSWMMVSNVMTENWRDIEARTQIARRIVVLRRDETIGVVSSTGL